jgi:peptidoglycan hydrolase-like protein with peptidoglycan-binding domain
MSSLKNNAACGFSLRCVILYFSLLLGSGGCDVLYRLLHKEGAQERELLGNVFSPDPNPKVEELQRLLVLYGYNPGTVDGKLGAKTRIAIERFQKDSGLPANRFLDKATWQRLNVFSQSGLVINGEVDIKKVQMILRSAGLNPGKIDGKMGAATQQALMTFQKAHGLKADGRIGFQTLSKLREYVPARQSAQE